MSGSSFWVELYLAAPGNGVDERSDAEVEQACRPLSASHNEVVNELLRRFDRPEYTKGRLNTPRSATLPTELNVSAAAEN